LLNPYRTSTTTAPQFSSGAYVPQTPLRSATNPFPQASQLQAQPQLQSLSPSQQASLSSSTFSDLISIQSPSNNSSLPLQYQPQSSFTPPSFSSPSQNPYASLSQSNGLGNPFPSALSQFNNSLGPGSGVRSASMPVFGQLPMDNGNAGVAMHSTGFNPFQQQQQFGGMVGSPPPLSTPTPGIQPVSNPFGAMNYGAMQQQPNAFAPQPQAMQQPTNPYAFSASPFGAGAYLGQQQQQQQQPSGYAPSPSPRPTPSPFAQQAQAIFQDMSPAPGTGTNPFFRSQGQGWGG